MIENVVRRQLTLFVPEDIALTIERVRNQYNSVQHSLIKSHVTLCREDEIVSLDKVLYNIDKIADLKCTLTFGKPIRFNDGKGVLLPAIGDKSAFHMLRKEILKDIIPKPRLSEAHITILHPRNGNCTDEIFDAIQKEIFPKTIQFTTISLIEQVNGGVWTVIKEMVID